MGCNLHMVSSDDLVYSARNLMSTSANPLDEIFDQSIKVLKNILLIKI
jgi:hypothetical protein